MKNFFIVPFVSMDELMRYQSRYKNIREAEDDEDLRAKVVDFKQGDVNGDGVKDNVFLIADRLPGEGILYRNITLLIQDGRTLKFTRVPLENNAGYNPTLFLGRFSEGKVNQILIVIDTGGSGGTIYSYVYSFLNNEVKKLFDSDKYIEEYKYGVTYRDNFKVDVLNKTLLYKFRLDIEYKGREYLSEIYDKNGKLKEPIEGFVRPLGGLYPIDFDRDGIYELYAVQGISGRYGADGLGYVETVLKWDGKRFKLVRQNVAIFGAEYR
ncbi:Conserved protein [Thermobrachium celere]|uniref:Conserved protein n=1 Tax=Thermobrachium celere DSM 8682 TaxID=941824 RepID=R7RTA9_9CLOT|nr:Conserved protein [Thermobrachium celere]GFR35437.1 hypothetical protein TCEA9_12490 [Thermobrachium celere]CDF59279.1 Conserved protein [Thermobrachium celere DSM 8682]